MPVPTNQTALTATAMTLNYAVTQPDIDLATPTPNCDVWYSYTAQNGEHAVGFLAFENSSANYNPVTTVWTGPASSPTQYLGPITASNVPMQVPVTAGTTYYFRIRNDSGVNPSAGTSLSVSALAAPTTATPAGSILINDDTNGFFAAAILSPTTGQVLRFAAPVVQGEGGDVLPTGEILLENIYDTPAPTVNLYTADAQFVQEIDFGNVYGSALIRTHNPSGKWYVGSSGFTVPLTAAFVTTVNADGSLGATTWTLPSQGLTGLAVNNAETIMYYTGQGAAPVLNAPIKRWDIVNDLPLSDLVAGVASHTSNDILVLADDTILVLYYDDVTPAAFARRYSTAGATLNTYTITGLDTLLPRLAYAINPTTFWWMYVEAATPQDGRIQNIRVSDGAVLTDLTSVVYNQAVYAGTPTATPEARFGRSASCPLLILRGSTPSTYETRDHYRRRQRAFPHLSEEQVWAFHKALQIDMETGVGLGDPDVPGAYNPQVMLDWSDDGGHTWSNVHNRAMGKMGEYRHRVLYRMLGRSRDRIYRITVSDPVRAYVIQGILDAEAGLS